MNLSLAITTMNRFEMTVKSFEKVLHDDRIDDIVILDDASTDGSFQKLCDVFGGEDKVRIIGRLTNGGMGRAKFEAIGYCRNPHVIIFDSDNTLDETYLDALDAISPHAFRDNLILMPEAALPGFNFSRYAGQYINANNAKDYLVDPMFRCAINCCNYVVPKDTYLKCYKEDTAVKGTDTINFNYNWLKMKCQFFVVPDMKYQHLQHSGSGFLADLDYNMKNAKEVEQKIMEL